MKLTPLHIVLFLLTFATTTLAGAEWVMGKSFFYHWNEMGWGELKRGLPYAAAFLGFLTVHEMGHFLVARWRRIQVTWPYYIPFWIVISTSIGTLGAFIRIKSKNLSRTDYFDIGVAGPLAGFVIALGVTWYGMTHLPPLDYVLSIHPDYIALGDDYRQILSRLRQPQEVIQLGDNLLFYIFREYVADPALFPHAYEVIHYPYLLAGYLGLFFTALNLLPIGQLDGGHILYGLIGPRAFQIVSPLLFTGLVFYSGLGLFTVEEFQTIDRDAYWELCGYFLLYLYFIYLCFSRITSQWITNVLISLVVVIGQLTLQHIEPTWTGYAGFLMFGFLLGRVLGVHHPTTTQSRPLSWWRQVLGWISMLIFILCFSPNPLI